VLNSLQVVVGAKSVGHRIEQEAILPHKLFSLLFILDWHPLIRQRQNTLCTRDTVVYKEHCVYTTSIEKNQSEFVLPLLARLVAYVNYLTTTYTTPRAPGSKSPTLPSSPRFDRISGFFLVPIVMNTAREGAGFAVCDGEGGNLKKHEPSQRAQLQNYLAQRTPGTHCLAIDSLCRVYLRKYMM
jgi:hypothetical protein